jgi:hypothetical protein
MRPLLCLTLLLAWTASAPAFDHDAEDQEALLGLKLPPVDPSLNNPWPEKFEQEFLRRAAHTLEHYADTRVRGTTWAESEKALYPRAFYAIITGDRKAAIKTLQAGDAGGGRANTTQGVDYYWCFTLKGQMRKYFLFDQVLDRSYIARMKKGAQAWLRRGDPLRMRKTLRDDPKWGRDWTPKFTGSDVDVRNTDNLRAMRDTSVYLMAEATGNEKVRRLYRRKILNYVLALYNIGMTEWDSANYLGHTLAPYHNLYDFARDKEVKLLAKAALDWMYAAAAVKYYRAGYCAPNARCYNLSTIVYDDPVSHPLSLYFGDNPLDDPDPHYDDIYHITSRYRPPAAVVHLARKHFEKPVHLSATHPAYDRVGYRPPWENWQPGDPRQPFYWETTFIGATYQMGSVVSEGPDLEDTPGGTVDHWCIAPFKLLADNSKRGADAFVCSTSGLRYSRKNHGNQVAQNRNLTIYLEPGDKRFEFLLPNTARIEQDGERWFIALEKTWLCLRPIHMDFSGIDKKLTEKIRYRTKRGKKKPRNPDEQGMSGQGRGGTFAGFALEVGDTVSHGEFETFKRLAAQKGAVQVDGNTVTLTGGNGASLRMNYNTANDLPEVWRDGRKVDYAATQDLYRVLEGPSIIVNEWHGGTLRVEAGGKVFEGRIEQNGRYTWQNE